MAKHYISTIDGKIFDSEKDLFEHIKENYMIENFEEENEKEKQQIIDNKISNIITKIKNSIPNSKIEVNVIPVKEKEDEFIFTIILEIQYDKEENLFEVFPFAVSNGNEIENTYQVFETIEEAIAYYSTFINETQNIKDELSKKYNVSNFKVKHWHSSDHYSTSPDYISFYFEIENRKINLDYEMNGLEKFMEVVNSYFEKEISGEVSFKEEGILIGNVPLNNFINRAAKVKITILEEK